MERQRNKLTDAEPFDLRQGIDISADQLPYFGEHPELTFVDRGLVPLSVYLLSILARKNAVARHDDIHARVDLTLQVEPSSAMPDDYTERPLLTRALQFAGPLGD